MSHRRRHSKLSPEILEYCPNYIEYDRKARQESKERINQHLSGRKNEISKCVERAIKDIERLPIEMSNESLRFIDDDSIIQSAARATQRQIDKWDGVQIKQCKKQDDEGKILKIDTYQKFTKKAKNHQDQTSWKISGDYFFAPYIQKARQFLWSYCESMMNVPKSEKAEIFDLACLSFADALFHGEIKFHRTKPKPLIRHRTLVKSTGIHVQLETLHSCLTVRRFISLAKNRRKSEDGKSNIIAGEFFKQLKKYTNQQYLQQKAKVYATYNLPVHTPITTTSIFDDNKHSEIDDDDHSNHAHDDNDDEMEQDQDIDLGDDDGQQSTNSDSPSSTPPSIGDNGADFDQPTNTNNNFRYKPRRKSRSKAHREFQPMTLLTEHKKQRQPHKRRQAHSAKVDSHCRQILQTYKANTASPPNQPSLSMDYPVSVINAINNPDDNCSDCNHNNNNNIAAAAHDDHTTVSSLSTATPITSTPSSVSPGRPLQSASMLQHAVNDAQKINYLRRANANLRREIEEMRFILNHSMSHYHPIPVQQYGAALPIPLPRPHIHPYCRTRNHFLYRQRMRQIAQLRRHHHANIPLPPRPMFHIRPYVPNQPPPQHPSVAPHQHQPECPKYVPLKPAKPAPPPPPQQPMFVEENHMELPPVVVGISGDPEKLKHEEEEKKQDEKQMDEDPQEEKMLFPDGTMMNDKNMSIPPPLFNGHNQSVMPFLMHPMPTTLESVDPFNSFHPNQSSMFLGDQPFSPDPLQINSAFLRGPTPGL